MSVHCPYCGKQAEYVDSKEVYKQSYGMMYLCRNCDAYVGVHAGTNKPLGTLANRELRGLRGRTHSLFDPLWKEGRMKRTEAYDWLSKKMNLDKKKCHMAMFSKSQCKKAIEILTQPF